MRRDGRGSKAKTACTRLGRGGRARAVMQILLTLWRVRQEGRGLDAKTACTQLGRGGQAGAVMQILLALNWAGALKPHSPSGGEVRGQGQ